jgi:hypothetical protein
MLFIHKAPQWLLDLTPEGGLRDWLAGWGWYVVLGFLGLLLLLLIWGVSSKLFGGKSKAAAKFEEDLTEDLGTYPPAPASTGDRRLLVEGVPVRVRLVVLAPAGNDADLDEEEIPRILEKVLPGLGLIFKADKPRVRMWPVQQSYKGFSTHLHRMTLIPEEDGELSPWIILAGRIKEKGLHAMLGLGLQALKPSTVGRRTLDAHEWSSVLRVRVRE